MVLAGAVLLGLVRDANAQSSGFLTRADFYLAWSKVVAADPRFSSEARVGLDADLADYGSGRITFGADYDAFLGHERRGWDLNQGTYRFDLAVSRRIGSAEVSGAFAHVSRHLVDRSNPPSISWNTVCVRARNRWTVGSGATIVDGRIGIARAMEQAVVDYAWTSEARVSVQHTPASWHRTSLLAEVSGTVIGTKREVYGRPRICGGRIEGGVRVNGDRAAVEAFLGYERRPDAYPTDRFRVRMWTFGLRLVSR